MQNEKKILSVIVPVYNVEKYLRDCINSILQQQIPNMEIIMINDGSTDSSGKICDEFADEDERITVIHKKNAGVSAARNTGLDIATGKYIIFADSDDVIAPGAYEILLAKVKSDRLVMGSIQFMAEDGTLQKAFMLDENSISQEEFIKDLFEEKKYIYLGYPVDKIYYREVIEKNHIRFNENIKLNEDRLFVLQYVQHCKYVTFLSEIVYYYRQRQNGIIMATRRNSSVTDSEMTVLDAFEEMKKICKGYSKEMYYICSRKSFESAIDLLNRVDKNDVKKIKRLRKFLWDNGRICLNNPLYRLIDKVKILYHIVLRK